MYSGEKFGWSDRKLSRRKKAREVMGVVQKHFLNEKCLCLLETFLLCYFFPHWIFSSLTHTKAKQNKGCY